MRRGTALSCTIAAAGLFFMLAIPAAAAQPASQTYDCQARITRVEVAPPVAAGDTDPWQCTAPGGAAMSSAVHWQRNSLEYCLLSKSVYGRAASIAESMAKKYGKRRWIVLMDADETVLDNSLFELERGACGNKFSDAEWESWVHASLARDVPGAAAFTNRVHRLGGLVAIITNRSTEDDAITQSTLKAAGIWFDYEIGQPKGAPSDKTSRWQGAVTALEAKFGHSLKPVMWLGDQVTDLAVVGPQGTIVRALTQKDEGKGIGSYLFVLPNPMYGNWTSNPAQ
jgi:5'-nucleotidase (lipoprotein e(P4) family)